ncbi:MAG: MBL fold metallo-hydrolase [Pseudomonadales bacterium]
MAVKIPFRRELTFKYGQVDTVAPGVRRVIANNPSPFTLHGTGTYIIGQGNVAVIDPGPADATHIANLLAAIPGETISHVLVTHTHMDHSPGCALLRQHSDAPTYGFGPHGAGKIAMGIDVEEGGDMEFAPDHKVVHGQIIDGDGWSIECVYTPGHTSNHLCFQLRSSRSLFTGDHVMGWSTSIISPPMVTWLPTWTVCACCSIATTVSTGQPTGQPSSSQNHMSRRLSPAARSDRRRSSNACGKA